MEIAICAIVKYENRYLREWIEYHKSIGVNKFIIYDNNSVNGEHPEDVIGDYIESGLVELRNIRGAKSAQIFVYKIFSENDLVNYDWAGFLDADEFMTLVNHDNLSDFFSQEHFNGFDVIHINWVTYGDNDLLHYEDKPVTERFTMPVIPLDKCINHEYPENCIIKSWVRGRKRVQWMNESGYGTTHSPAGPGLKACDERGREVICPTALTYEISIRHAYIRHYYTKTIEEYALKTLKGWANTSFTQDKIRKDCYNIDIFSKYCEVTDEKIEVYNNTLEQLDRQIAPPIVYVYVLCFNEMRILPFVIDYWKYYATKVIVYDNGSTDGTLEELAKYGDFIDIRHFDSDGTMDDILHLKLKMEIWHECHNTGVDIVQVSDFDEIMYADNMIESLKWFRDSDYTLIKPNGFEAISLAFPEHQNGKLLHQYNDVYLYPNDQWFSKTIMFKPDDITDIHYTMVGAHTCEPTGNVKFYESTNGEWKLIHLKRLGLDYIKSKNIILGDRQCEHSRTVGFNRQYRFTDEEMFDEFSEMWRNKIEYHN